MLEHSGDALANVILVEDKSPEPQMGLMLEELRTASLQIRLLRKAAIDATDPVALARKEQTASLLQVARDSV